MKQNMVAWFEIPVNDMNRAKAFYEKVFNLAITVVDFGGTIMGWFPNQGEAYGATGTLILQESYVPSQKGTLVYFSSEDISTELDRVEAAGGTIYKAKTQISPEQGYMGVFIDSEGNRVALHANA
jgi:predicted enzyme related to lactoylglutathione lyase